MMSKLVVANLVQRLIGEFGYSPHAAQVVAEELADADERIQEAFLRWWTKGELSNLTVRQYNLRRLKDEHGMNPIAAFLTLDWLLKEPGKALASLARGHDRVE
jgi:hypothetical protein